MVRVTCVNGTRRSIVSRTVARPITAVLRQHRRRSYTCSVAFVGPTRMTELNARYRRHRRPTTILSFAYGPDAGELILCPTIIERNARQQGIRVAPYLRDLLIHGTLHLLGYDHTNDTEERRMEQRADQARRALNTKSVRPG